MVFQDNFANLFYLIRLRLISRALNIYLLFNTLLSIKMMTTANSLIKAKIKQYLSNIIKG